MPASGVHQLNITLDKEVKEKFKSWCRRRDTSVTEVITKYINDCLLNDDLPVHSVSLDYSEIREKVNHAIQVNLAELEEKIEGKFNHLVELTELEEKIESKLKPITDRLDRLEKQQEIEKVSSENKKTTDTETANMDDEESNEQENTDSSPALSAHVDSARENEQIAPSKGENDSSLLDDDKEKIESEDKGLTQTELAARFGYASASSLNSSRLPLKVRSGKITFTEWSKSKDPDGIAWEKREEKYFPVTDSSDHKSKKSD